MTTPPSRLVKKGSSGKLVAASFILKECKRNHKHKWIIFAMLTLILLLILI